MGVGTILNKQIFFLLLMVTAAINSMQITNDNGTFEEKVLCNVDTLSHITKQLCMGGFTIYKRKYFASLSCTNQFFNRYYSAEDNRKTIIRTIACNNYSNDEVIAAELHYHSIKEKIDYFLKVAKNKEGRFTQEDLKEKWYLSVTNFWTHSLAHIAIENNNLVIAKLIIDHLGSDLTYKELSRLEGSIYWKIMCHETSEQKLDQDILSKCKKLRSMLQNQILLCKQKEQD